MAELLRYEAARAALAEAVRIDDVKQIKDHAERIELYAKQMHDHRLLAAAVDIQFRAKCRMGELLMAAAAAGDLAHGRPKKIPAKAGILRLADLGITSQESSDAQKLASMSEGEIETIAADLRERILARGAKVVSPANTADKKARRAERERDLGRRQVALPTEQFGVILADPEWQFEPWSRETGMDRSPDNHYPTSCLDVIASRDVASIAAKDCVLFLWATVPMLPHAIIVMGAWGFNYQSHYIWDKVIAGTGYWSRNSHELLLIGTKGKPPAPAPGTQEQSVIMVRKGKHSEKPEIFLEMIERYFPTLPKIELNRRGPAREGWSAWGNEVVAPVPAHDPQTGEILESVGYP